MVTIKKEIEKELLTDEQMAEIIVRGSLQRAGEPSSEIDEVAQIIADVVMTQIDKIPPEIRLNAIADIAIALFEAHKNDVDITIAGIVVENTEVNGEEISDKKMWQ